MARPNPKAVNKNQALPDQAADYMVRHSPTIGSHMLVFFDLWRAIQHVYTLVGILQMLPAPAVQLPPEKHCNHERNSLKVPPEKHCDHERNSLKVSLANFLNTSTTTLVMCEASSAFSFSSNLDIV